MPNTCSLFDVFLSCRGDILETHAVPLYLALKRAKLDPYLYVVDPYPGGRTVEKLKDIVKQYSASAIIILSKDYATSNRCLDELVLILDRIKTSYFPLMTIYCDGVSYKTFEEGGIYQKALEIHKKNFTEERVKKWSEALKELEGCKYKRAQGSKLELDMFFGEIADEIREKITPYVKVPLSIPKRRLQNSIRKILEKNYREKEIKKLTVHQGGAVATKITPDPSGMIPMNATEHPDRRIPVARQTQGLHYEETREDYLERQEYQAISSVEPIVKRGSTSHPGKEVMDPCLEEINGSVHEQQEQVRQPLDLRIQELLENYDKELEKRHTEQQKMTLLVVIIVIFAIVLSYLEKKNTEQQKMTLLVVIIVIFTVMFSYLDKWKAEELKAMLSFIVQWKVILPFKVFILIIIGMAYIWYLHQWITSKAPEPFDHVFLSCRSDILKTHAEPLNKALQKVQLRTFYYGERKSPGRRIEEKLQEGIDRSASAIIIFSKAFARSNWCLDEVVLILERKRKSNYPFIPIYCDGVNYKDLTFENGISIFHEALETHKKIYGEKKVNEWIQALKDIGGREAKRATGSESELKTFFRQVAEEMKKEITRLCH